MPRKLPASASANTLDDCATYAALKAQTALGGLVQVGGRATEDDGGGGLFRWLSGDQSANVTGDPQGGVYVPPDSDTDGSSGCWERVGWQNMPLKAEMFGGFPGAASSTAINAAITFLNAKGGGTLLISGRTAAYQVGTSITLRTNVAVILDGATLDWTASGGTVITSPSDDVLLRAELRCRSDGKIDADGAQHAVYLHSHQHCDFDLEITGTITGTVFRSIADSTAGSGLKSNRNSVMNNYWWIGFDGSAAEGVRLEGSAADGSFTRANVLNTLHSCHIDGVTANGLYLGAHCDNNHYPGYCRYSLLANNAIGVEATADATCYSHSFGHLAIDAYGAFTGRKAIKLGNGSRFFTVADLFTDFTNTAEVDYATMTDTQEDAALFDFGTAKGIEIRHHRLGTDTLRYLRRDNTTVTV